jgi:hypothetical protein
MPEGAASEWRQAHSGETRTHAHELEGGQLVDKSHKKDHWLSQASQN